MNPNRKTKVEPKTSVNAKGRNNVSTKTAVNSTNATTKVNKKNVNPSTTVKRNAIQSNATVKSKVIETNAISKSKSSVASNTRKLDSKANAAKVNESKKVIAKINETPAPEKKKTKNDCSYLSNNFSKGDQLTSANEESISVEPPSISEHDISDPILNDNHSPNENDYDYDFSEFDEYESDFDDDFEEEVKGQSEEESEEKQSEQENEEKQSEEEKEQDYSELEYENEKSLPASKVSINETQTEQRSIAQLTSEENRSKREANYASSSESSTKLINKRVIDLSEIIKLNTVDYNICDSAPINYDVFMQLFGRKNRKQVYIQSKDLVDEETQTDCIVAQDCSTQNSDICRDSRTESECDVNPFSLLSYLEKASQKLLCLIAFESNSSKEGKNKLQIPTECKHFCSKYYKLNSARIAKSATINLIHSDSHYLFAVQNVAKLKGCSEKSIISLWLHCNCSSPEITLIARSHVQCLTHNNSVVVAGMIDGTIALWDLNESHCFHKQITVEHINYTLRSCSFSTAVTSINVHENSVVSIEALSACESGQQIASIDEKGLLSLWIIVDTYQTEFSFTENADGMMPGSKVRLAKVWTVSLLDKSSIHSIVSMKCSNVDEYSAFIIGLDSGLVSKVNSFEPQKSVTYKPFEAETELTPVTSICCHLSEPTFLVAYKGGEICLFSLQQNTPISVFASKNIVNPISIHWLSPKSNAFAILESNGFVSIHNCRDNANKAIVYFNNDSSRITSLSPSKVTGFHYLVFGTENGSIHVMHYNEIT